MRHQSSKRMHSHATGGRRVMRLLGRLLAVVSLVAVGISAGYAGVWLRRALASGELFAIENIVVEGNKTVAAEEIRAYAGVVTGEGLYSFNAKQIENAVVDHPLVAHARVIRRPPHELRLLVVEQHVVAYAALEHLYVVNTQGELFARAETLGGVPLPVITGVDVKKTNDEQAWRQDVRAALEAIGALTRHGFVLDEIAEIHVTQALGIELVLNGVLGRVQLGTTRRFEKMAQLAALRKYLVAQNKRASHVFLSDGPDSRRVVVRWENVATTNDLREVTEGSSS